MTNNDVYTEGGGSEAFNSDLPEGTNTGTRLVESANSSREHVPLIEVRNLTKIYRTGQSQVPALRGVSFQIQQGEFVAIMGPSGSGKSTLMNLLGCLDRPTSGSYSLASTAVSRLSANKLADIRNRMIGFVFQNFNLLSRTTAQRNVALPLMYAGIPRLAQDKKSRKVLSLLGLKKRMQHKPMELSGGQQQRVAIARALVNNPSLLLADEPTGNLDSQTSVEIMATLQALNDMGLTVVVVTHDPDVAAYATRCITFRDGQIVSDVPVTERRSASEFWSADSTSAKSNGAQAVQSVPMQQKSTPRPVRDDRNMRKRGRLFLANVTSATRALLANRLRSLLTMLGIMIGVGAVIAAVTLTQGISELLNENLSGLGTNVLNISPNGMQSTLTEADANSIAGVEHVVHVSPVLLINGQIIYNGQRATAQVQAVNTQYQIIGNWTVADGEWFSNDDDQLGAAVAVIGKTVADNLFTANGVSPIGQKILISGQIFRVVGVLEAKGSQGATNQDNVVFVPLTFAKTHLKSSPYVDQIQVQVDSADNVTTTQAAITTLMQSRHNTTGSQKKTMQGTNTGGLGGSGGPGNISSANSSSDFTILNANQLLQTLQQQGQAQATLLIGIAAISLTVGGIGVMNIMLVSVTERTREIGIRMAVGARRGYIRNQFLIEALALCSVGGLIGILLGLGGGLFLVRTSNQNLPFVLSPTYMLLAFGVSAIVGVIFGLYPAIRASQLDPIVALHAE